MLDTGVRRSDVPLDGRGFESQPLHHVWFFKPPLDGAHRAVEIAYQVFCDAGRKGSQAVSEARTAVKNALH